MAVPLRSHTLRMGDIQKLPQLPLPLSPHFSFERSELSDLRQNHRPPRCPMRSRRSFQDHIGKMAADTPPPFGSQEKRHGRTAHPDICSPYTADFPSPLSDTSRWRTAGPHPSALCFLSHILKY